MPLDPTDEQSHVISLVRDGSSNILINALAGTGKTSTLDFVQAASRDQPVLCLAFNKRIADEMVERFPSTTTVRTFNSLGHRIWSKTVSNVTLQRKKTQEHLATIIDELRGEDRQEIRDNYWEIVSAVGLAKNLGYVPEGKYPHTKRLLTRTAFLSRLDFEASPLIADVIDTLLLLSIKTAYSGAIDYNDQIYMPSLFGGTFPRFPLVLVDEYQDLNPSNIHMLSKLARNRVCAVGDDWQSIYAFRGAQQGAMSRFAEEYEAVQADLTVSFRCPENVVKAVHWRVPKLRWLKPGGVVSVLKNPTLAGFSDSCAILCRNNAPLFSLAFRLLGAGRSVSVAGSDIGPKLIRIMERLGDANDTTKHLLGKISAWAEAKLEASTAPKTIEDMAACMRVFASFGTTLGSAVAHAKHLFEQKGQIKLMTGHKAKGLEWDQVYHLDSWLLGEEEQELNLRYVISTRAKEALYEIDSRDVR
jgi:DNA helicase-2/ATP-dependent DNA helicase PcrA